jgi:hypothetical protein
MFRRVTLGLLLLLVPLTMAFCCYPGAAQSDAAQTGDAQIDMQSKAQGDPIKLYALMETDFAPEPGPIARAWQQWVPIDRVKRGARPMLIWYHWANQPKPFVPSLLIILFASAVVTSVLPNWTVAAQAQCKAHFWRTFFVGALIGIVGITGIRAALATQIGWSLSILITAALELALVAGLSVMVLAIGQSVGYFLKMESWIQRPDIRRLAYLLLGALICAALLQLPGVGVLPKIGARLLGLLALVGLGGLYRTRIREAQAP